MTATPCPHHRTRFAVRASGVEVHRCDDCGGYWAELDGRRISETFERQAGEDPARTWREVLA